MGVVAEEWPAEPPTATGVLLDGVAAPEPAEPRREYSCAHGKFPVGATFPWMGTSYRRASRRMRPFQTAQGIDYDAHRICVSQRGNYHGVMRRLRGTQVLPWGTQGAHVVPR